MNKTLIKKRKKLNVIWYGSSNNMYVACNVARIEETLQKLVHSTNSLSLDNNYTNIKDAMDSLIQTPVLEECACLTPDTEDVNRLLKAIVSINPFIIIFILRSSK